MLLNLSVTRSHLMESISIAMCLSFVKIKYNNNA